MDPNRYQNLESYDDEELGFAEAEMIKKSLDSRAMQTVIEFIKNYNKMSEAEDVDVEGTEVNIL
ncbi:MAG: hypothetical protein IIA45_15775 [Bacteroidetes bacterium]|nr:hypothetical protein [Bacteroidota bacterium]